MQRTTIATIVNNQRASAKVLRRHDIPNGIREEWERLTFDNLDEFNDWQANHSRPVLLVHIDEDLES